MSLFKSMGAGGHPVWIDAHEVIALENVYSDRTLQGEAENAKLLTRVHLTSGGVVEIDAEIDDIARRVDASAR